MSNILKYKTKFKLRDVAILLSIFLVLYVYSSYNIPIIHGVLSIGISLISAVTIFFLHRNAKSSSTLLLIIILLCINVTISGFLMGDTIKNISIMILTIIISFIFVTAISLEEYFEKYNKIMYAISFYSLVTYMIAVFFPNIIRMFPGTYYRPSKEVYNLGLAFVNLRGGTLIRNMGIFWEPGAFQTFLVIAIIGEVFILRSVNKKALIVFFLTLLTTWSTTGLINGFILIMIYLIDKNSYRKSKGIKIFFGISLFVLFTFTIYQILPYEYQYAFFGKVTTFLDSDQSKITSAYVRYTSIIYPLKAFLSSPLLGVGYSGLEQSVLQAGHTMATNTPINWFASYGIIFGTVCLSGVYGLVKKIENRSNLIKGLTFIVIILSISTEQYLRNISIFIFILYGIKNNVARSNKFE